MKPVFLDTGGLIAIWDKADQWHALARPVFAALLSARRRMVTTPQVLLECGNAAARRVYRPEVYNLRQILQANQALIEPTAAEIEQAWTGYLAGIAGNAGIVDQISFIAMRRLGITEAFTHNGHFNAAGFTTLF